MHSAATTENIQAATTENIQRYGDVISPLGNKRNTK